MRWALRSASRFRLEALVEEARVGAALGKHSLVQVVD